MDSWSRELGLEYAVLSQGTAPVGGPFPSDHPGRGDAWFILLGVDLVLTLAFSNDQANIAAIARGQRFMAGHFKSTVDAELFWVPWRGNLVFNELDDFSPEISNGSPLCEITWTAWGIFVPK